MCIRDSLWGTEDVDNITLEWIVDAAADPEEILLTFTAFNGTTETIALPGDVRQATTQKSTGGYYTITYTEEGQAHTSNPWYPLPYPHCFPTNIINPDLIPPVYQTCFFPLPV